MGSGLYLNWSVDAFQCILFRSLNYYSVRILTTMVLLFAASVIVFLQPIYDGVLGETNCTCVPYYQCSEETGRLITDGIGLFDVRDFRNNKCTGYFDICCNLTLNAPPAYDSSIEEEKEDKPQGCGYHVPGVFPWSVTLQYQKIVKIKSVHKCGASLIHPQVALTAAHCVNDSGLYSIKIEKQITPVSKIVTHPKFNIDTLRYDVAILILHQPLALSEKLGVICIPPPRFNILNNHCIASSWKQSEKNSNDITQKLVKLPIIPRKKCEETLRATRLGAFFQLHKTFICAGGETEDTCDGDGGNPLVCPIPGEKDRYHQTGIVSWGIGCGEFNMPGVYVNLSIFRNWIDKVMNKSGFGINSYRY